MGWSDVQAAKKKIEFDEEGYACCKTDPPEDYDLVILQKPNGKELFGWKQGNEWAGRFVKKEDTFVKWRRTGTCSM
jgi:hypothetical protein